MIITRAILEILDYRSGVNQISNKELDLSSDTTIEYLLKILKKVNESPNRKRGAFVPESKFQKKLEEYKAASIPFVDFASEITKDLNIVLQGLDDKYAIDLLIAEYREEEATYFSIVFLENKESITHTVVNNDGVLENKIVKNFSILPSSSINLNTFVTIGLDDFIVYSQEKPRKISNEEHRVLEEYIESVFALSNNETYRMIKNVTSKVCEDHGVNPAIAMTKIKSFLAEQPEVKAMSPEEISKKAFESELAIEDFNAKMHTKGIVDNINLDHEYVLKKAVNHKIKTDTGIEITFPSDLYQDDKHLEFIEEEDGTISIKIKAVNKIINR